MGLEILAASGEMEKVKRDDLLKVDPKDIFVDENLNGRRFAHTQEDIEGRCNSFEQVGQLQAVEVRRLPNKQLQLTMGYLRYRAAQLYNQRHPETPMLLKCTLVTCNEIEALQRNIIENRERKKTTPIDDAHNQRNLRDRHGWSDVQIADFFKQQSSYVGQLKRLLLLGESIQIQLHKGEISLESALALSDLNETEQKAALAPIVEPTPEALQPIVNDPTIATTPTTAVIVERVRNIKVSKGGKHPRNLAAFRKYLEALQEAEDSTAELKELSGLLVKFIQGNWTDKTMSAKVQALLKTTATEATV